MHLTQGEPPSCQSNMSRVTGKRTGTTETASFRCVNFVEEKRFSNAVKHDTEILDLRRPNVLHGTS